MKEKARLFLKRISFLQHVCPFLAFLVPIFCKGLSKNGYETAITFLMLPFFGLIVGPAKAFQKKFDWIVYLTVQGFIIVCGVCGGISYRYRNESLPKSISIVFGLFAFLAILTYVFHLSRQQKSNHPPVQFEL